MLNAALDRNAAGRPHREALVTGSERVTFEVLRRRVGGLCDRLQQLGLQPGTLVPLLLDNDPHFVVALLAVLRMGAFPLPLPPTSTREERTALLEGHSMPLALVNQSLARELSTEGFAAVVLAEPFIDEAEPAKYRDLSGAELLVPTSGSTGQPKIVRLSEAGCVWNALAHAESIDLGGEDRLLVASPLYHSATLVAQLIAALWHGATLVLMRGPFMPQAYLEAIEVERITVSSLTPTDVRLIHDERSMRSQVSTASDLSSLKVLTVGAMPIDPALVREFAAEVAEKSAAKLYLTYGLTEAGPRVTTLPAEFLPERPDSVGLPLRGIEVRVVDPQNREVPLPVGSEGELQLRTPSRMIGFLGEPPLKDGWLPTGDLAILDAEGYVTLRGRIKETAAPRSPA